MDLALNNLQGLICIKTQPTNPCGKASTFMLGVEMSVCPRGREKKRNVAALTLQFKINCGLK